MKIISASIHWHKGYGNLPDLKVVVDKLPVLTDVIFKKHTDGMTTTYWTAQDDFVTFFTHVPGNQSGYGGAIFEIHVEGESPNCGSTVKVKGPWSDNALNVNNYFPPSHNCSYYQEESDFPEMGYAAHIKMAKAIELIDQCGAEFTFIKQYGGRKSDMEVTDEKLIDELTQKVVKGEIIGYYDLAICLKGMSLEESQEKKNLDDYWMGKL